MRHRDESEQSTDLVHKSVSQYAFTWIVVIVRSFLDRSRRTPKGAPVEPFRVSSQHLVVELFCCRGLSGEFLKIKNVLPELPEDPSAVVIILHILVAGDDNTGLERLHLVQC